MMMKRLRRPGLLTESAILLVLALLVFVPRVTDLGRFQAHDESMRSRQSLDSFLAIAEGRWGDVYSANFGATNLTWARTTAKLLHFGWLRLQGVEVTLAEMAHRGLEFDPLPGAIFNGLVTLAVYAFARKLFARPTAILITAMLALDPFLLSEARIWRTESALATFITLTVLSLAIYARTRQRRYLAWSAFWMAWSLATKITGIIMVAVVGLVLLIMVLQDMRLPTLGQKTRRLALDGLLWAGLTAAFTFAIWPTLWATPIQALSEVINLAFFLATTSKESLDFFFRGQVVSTLPPLYYLLVLLYKTTPLAWLGLLALAWTARQAKKEPGPTWAGVPFPLAGGLIILLAALVYTLAMATSTFKTERYMMTTVSLLDVAAALGLAEMARRLYRRRRLEPGLFWAAALGLFLVGHGLFAWLHHPYYFSYHNPLLGGSRTAVHVLQIGSGEGLDRAMAYLNQKPNPTQQAVVCGTNLPRCEYLSAGQTLLKRDALNAVHATWVGADYVVTYIFQRQRGDYPPGVIAYLAEHPGPEYVATFRGIDYAAVYPAPGAQYVAASTLAGISTLLGYDVAPQQVTPGQVVHLKFYWENDGSMERPMFVRLTDADGYAWSETNAAILPEFTGLVNRREAILEGEARLPIPVGMPPGRYYLKMGYQSQAGQLIGRFSLPQGGDTITVGLPEQFGPPPELPHPLPRPVDPALMLLGYGLDRTQAAPGGSLWLTLYWQARQDVAADYVVNLRLLDQAGAEAAYWLGRPVRSSYPTDRWQAGQVVQDPWQLTLPADLPPGSYRLQLVLFDAATEQPVMETPLQAIQVEPKQPPAMQFESGAQFGPYLTLLGYDLYFTLGDSAPGVLAPTFYWQSRADFEATFELQLSLRAADSGQLIRQWSVPLGADGYRADWQAGQTVSTPYRLEGQALSEGAYHLDVALQERASGQAVPVTGSTFLRIENIQDKITIQVTN